MNKPEPQTVNDTGVSTGQHHPTINNTTAEERADQLEQFLNLLPCDPLLMPFGQQLKNPVIADREIKLDSRKARNLLVTGGEAVEQIRQNNADGFCLYFGKESHNTERLAAFDHDDPELFPPDSLPETLLIVSGSGTGFHQLFINSGNVSNATAKGDLKGAGSIRAHNWYIATPGSVHTSEGIYYIKEARELAELSTSDLPPELQPTTTSTSPDESSVTEDEINQLSDGVNKAVVEKAKHHLSQFQDDNPAAFKCLMDRLNGGRGDYADELSRQEEPSKIDRDLQEKTVLTHLYGIFRQAGESKKQSKQFAYQILSHYCSNNGYTKDGAPRKWIKRNEKYRRKQLNYAVEQYDRVEFNRFCNQSSDAESHRKRSTNEYSEPTRGLSRFIVHLRSNFFQLHGCSQEQIHQLLLENYNYSMNPTELQTLLARHDNRPPTSSHPMYNDTTGLSVVLKTGDKMFYPKKSDVKQWCVDVDASYKGNSEESFDRCLTTLQKEGYVCVAQIESGKDYRIYPFSPFGCIYPDPPQADWVRVGGKRK